MKFYTLNELFDAELIQPRSFIGDGVLPVGGKMVIAGPRGIGKSTLIVNAMYDAAAGDDLFGLKELAVKEPLRILYFESEVKLPGLKERFGKIHALKQKPVGDRIVLNSSVSEIYLAAPMGDEKAQAKSSTGMWLQIIAEHKPNIIICDPLSTFHSVAENSNDDAIRLTNNIDSITAAAKEDFNIDISWIIMHHFKKLNPDDLLSMDSARGAGRIMDWADTRVLMNYTTKQFQDGVELHMRPVVFACVRQGPPINDIWMWIDEDSSSMVVHELRDSTGLQFD